jgi:hypothetical protein
MVLNSSKKAMLFWQLILVIISLIVISVSLWIVSVNEKNMGQVLVQAPPKLPSLFPSAVVHSFLTSPVSVESKDPEILSVSDLIWNDKLEDLKSEREKYIEKITKYQIGQKTMFKLYQDQSSKAISSSDIIDIKYDVDFSAGLPSLYTQVLKENYYYVLKTKSGKLVVISFLPISEIQVNPSSSPVPEQLVIADTQPGQVSEPIFDSESQLAQSDAEQEESVVGT